MECEKTMINEVISELLLTTENKFIYCISHGRYIFDKEIKIVLEQFQNEDFLIDMHSCVKHPNSRIRYYYWSN